MPPDPQCDGGLAALTRPKAKRRARNKGGRLKGARLFSLLTQISSVVAFDLLQKVIAFALDFSDSFQGVGD